MVSSLYAFEIFLSVETFYAAKERPATFLVTLSVFMASSALMSKTFTKSENEPYQCVLHVWPI